MVNPTPYGGGAAPLSAYDPFALLEGNNKRAIKFVSKDANGYDLHAPVGTQFTGLVVGEMRANQVIDFETKVPKTYPNGDPVKQVIIDLQTELRDDEDDDGIRTLYVKGQMLSAFQAAALAWKQYGRIGEGSRVTVTLIQLKNVGKGNPQKIYQIDLGPEYVAYVPPEARQAQTALGYPAGAAPQQQWANPAQPQFPGQVVPAAQPVQQVPVQQYQQPVAPQAPVQQVPQYPAAIQPQGLPQAVQPQGVPTQEPSPALAAINAIAAPAQAGPAAPQQGAITQEHLDAYANLTSNGIDPQTAINGLSQKLAGGDPAFVAALAAAVGVQAPATA